MINLAAVIAGAVNGAVQQVIPPVAADVVKTIHKAADAPPTAPTPSPPAALDPDVIAARVIEKVLQHPAVDKVATPIEWWKSQAIWGGLVAAAAPILGLLGYALSPEDAQQIATALVGIASAVGGLLAIYGRLTTTRQIKGT